MKLTDEDIFVLAYFEAEDRRRKNVHIPCALAQLASRAPNRPEMTKNTLFHGWLADVGGKQYALTLSGQQHLADALRAEEQGHA